MLSSLSPAATAFLNGLDLIQRRSQKAQTELTTGLKINDVSDEPSQIPLLFQTQSELARSKQVTSNLNSVKAEVDTGEGALQSAVTMVEQAQTLGSQGQTGFATADTRTQIAGQLGMLLQQLVSVANTTQGGRYIFGGDSDQTAPYAVDLTQTNPISAYAGSTTSRQVESPDGTTFAVAKTAQDIFDSPGSTTNVFQTINTMRNALLNNDQAAIDAAIPDLKTAGTYLNQQLAFYGVTQDQVNNGLSTGATLTTQLSTQLSGIQDADATSAIIDFQSAQTQQQAALTSWSKLPRSSLFDYLG
jgi:flagellar hook-associated protein 3 FlgL